MRAKKFHQHMLAAAVILAIGSKASIAATYTWTGGNSSLWDATDWPSQTHYINWGNSLTLPGPADDVVFQGAINYGPDLDISPTINSLTFDTTSSFGTLGIGRTLTLESGIITRTAQSSGYQSLDVPIVIGSNAIWNLQGSGGIAIGSGVSDGGNGYGITKIGSADLTISDVSSIGGPLTVSQGNVLLQGSSFSTSAQGNDSLLVTNPGSTLTEPFNARLSTLGRPRIDNGGTVSVSYYSGWINGADKGGINEVVVGQSGSGTLNLSNVGTIQTGVLTLGAQPGSNGTLSITTDGQLTANAVNAGVLGTASISIDGSSGNGGPHSGLNAHTLNLGINAPATLLLTNGSRVMLTPDPNNPQAPGMLNMGPQSTVTLDGGILVATGISGNGLIDLKSDPYFGPNVPVYDEALELVVDQGDSTVQARFTGAGGIQISTNPYATEHFLNCSDTTSGEMQVQGNLAVTGGTYTTTVNIFWGNVTFDGGVVLQGSTVFDGEAQSVIYDNATLNQCTLTSYFQEVKNAVFNSTTISPSTIVLVVPAGQLTLNNSIVSGQLRNQGQMSINGLTVTSTGDLELSSTAANPVSVTGLEIDGKMNVNSGSLVDSVLDLALGAGSVSTVKPGAQITLSGTTVLSMHGATLFNDGTITGPVNINSNSVAGGSGQYTGSLNVFAGGRVWPGDGASSSARIATLLSSSSAWNDGGIFHWEISTSAGTPGVAWDLWNAGTTSITPTGIFDVEIESLGSLPDWDASTSHSWLIATSDNGAFTPDALSHLAIIDDGFASAIDLAGGSLSLTDSADGADLYLTFTPAPEPASIACLTLCAGGLLLGRRRRK